MISNTPQNSRTVYTVTELNSTIRKLLESEFPLMWVEGEISNLAQPASGHIYFSLKDSKAQVRCAMFKNRKQLLRFKPENGQQVQIRAKVGLYEARGEFQLIVEHMEEAGDGALQRAYDALKNKLSAQGLFDDARKQALPELPKHIGVVTSATGAAIQDVLSVLKRRFPAIPVRIYAVPVQGEKAAAEIAKALYRASEQNDCDVLLLIRGGGSLEDLWAFNEEILAHAIADCKIPIVSGVGHETDVTISDFAADHRAPTPSAAAELISPNQQTYLHRFQNFQNSLIRLMQTQIKQCAAQAEWLQSRLKVQHPSSQLQQQQQQLDELIDGLQSGFMHISNEKSHELKYLLQGLINNRPDQFIDYQQVQLGDLLGRLQYQSQLILENKQQALSHISRTLHAVSPLNTLSRGYSITRDQNNKTVSDAKQLHSGDTIKTQLEQGEVISVVK